jgi:hypothetical protein
VVFWWSFALWDSYLTGRHFAKTRFPKTAADQIGPDDGLGRHVLFRERKTLAIECSFQRDPSDMRQPLRHDRLTLAVKGNESGIESGVYMGRQQNAVEHVQPFFVCLAFRPFLDMARSEERAIRDASETSGSRYAIWRCRTKPSSSLTLPTAP